MKHPHLLAVVAALSLVGVGCNPVASVEKKVGDAAAGAAVHALTNGQVDADVSGGAVTMKDAQTGASVALGGDVKIPDDFPKDVPVYAGAKVVAVLSSKESDRASLGLQTADDAQTVVSWYETTLKGAGFTLAQSMSVSGSEIRLFKKDTVQIEVDVMTNADTKTGSDINVVRVDEGAGS